MRHRWKHTTVTAVTARQTVRPRVLALGELPKRRRLPDLALPSASQSILGILGGAGHSWGHPSKKPKKTFGSSKPAVRPLGL